ncbi:MULTISPECIES: DMT family transporter [unclassified Sporosarcina]|uniref:DMT family transporter n=1 Tax=unclassified Sporosarcina TaxID=2647733 RepID=UPI000C173405|nr:MULTISPECIES: DMT family transporter [unclassified Sporosarcina]PIC99302.1 EamA family transporter [Sporosarcina sp. P29]PID03461.1 EamA family transporter [Sporosarcina sp. P30]PID07446.1 EamA family transporter [Sporosarcina sp. P31]PID10639.1 EamA family transporter [Sporosarcina sp. P32b]
MNKPSIHPYIPIAIGVLTVGLSAIFVKMATADAGVIAFYRMFFSAVIMLPLFLISYRSELTSLTKKDWLFTASSGIFLAIHFILWFESLNYTSVASSTVLVTLQPIFALAGTALFFKEIITGKMLTAVIVALTGSFIISWGDFQVSGAALFGDLLALLACAFVTAYLLIGQNVRKRISLVTYTFLVYSISSVTLFFYVLLTQEPFFGYPAADWGWFLALAILPNLLGHTLFNWAVKWVSTNVVSIAILFEPVLASIAAYFVLHEKITSLQLGGAIVVLAGVLLFVIDVKAINKKLFTKNT